ncbi:MULTISPECIES: TonB-dependent siderophore receptor [unclassified Sphingomonas]|uniref:TonB-dependent siderophore receptor n=1 Tax=unclassified Sphingomonas TaxID=196159 RepID=UPI000E713751|nr:MULTISPECIES: TonB-dependent siderophore receptor [unclassified Sphingomonas]RKE50438.1 iron complex outermembrane receptor protein [Sphingomonas sp. PP-CC-1A-547]TCM08732.1 iron complex outermembrane receptor protein [Sphingomonas sp. PP-CC-3G-468]
MTRRLGIAILLGSAAFAVAPGYAQTLHEDASDVIVVTGQHPRDQASSGTKTDTPLAETPQSITVITADDIAGRSLQNLNQALRFVAGVTPETRGSSGEVYDQFKLRGFDAPVYLDGLKQFGSPSGYAVPQVDVSRLDRIEVIKGPASVLYGQSSPGGLVAESSKLPLDQALYGAISGTYGNYDLYRVDADIGGRAGEGVLWRINGSANGADTQQKFGKRERQTISGAVTAGAGSSTSFTLLGAYSHDPYNGDYGVFPASGTLLANPNGKLPTSFDGGEAGNRFSREQAALTYIFRHDFGGGWAFRSSGRYQYVKSALGLIYTAGGLDGSDPTQQTFSRASYATREQLNNWTFDNQLTGTVQTGLIKHTLLFGVDRQVAHSRELAAFGVAPPLNGFAPVYGTVTVPTSPEQIGGQFAIDVQQRQQGIYAQDQMALGDLRVVLSGRQDWARAQQDGRVKHDKKFTYRAAALYTLPFGLAPYVSYSTSFEQQANPITQSNGQPGLADPSLGKQIEAGAKFSIPGTQILLSGAWFRIDQTNVLTSTPNFSVSRQTGGVRSQGVEFEGSAPLPYGFNARVAFSRQRVKVTSDADAPARVGRGLETVGRGGTSAYLDWTPRSGGLEGLTIGGAVRHVDEVYAGVTPGETAGRNSPSHTVYDALIRYDLEKFAPSLRGLSLAVNGANIFEKKYLTSCFANYNWCWYGNRRTVQATIGYRF